MVPMASVVLRFFVNDGGSCRFMRVLEWCRAFAKVDHGGNNANGAEHSSLRNASRDCGDDSGELPDPPYRRSFADKIEPGDILGGVALCGLILYALLRGMDATIAAMLTGLFGVILGRSSKYKNGKNGDQTTKNGSGTP